MWSQGRRKVSNIGGVGILFAITNPPPCSKGLDFWIKLGYLFQKFCRPSQPHFFLRPWSIDQLIDQPIDQIDLSHISSSQHSFDQGYCFWLVFPSFFSCFISLEIKMDSELERILPLHRQLEAIIFHSD